MMIGIKSFPEIRALIALHGGVGRCAAEIGADQGNVSRWLKAIEQDPPNQTALGNLGEGLQARLFVHIGIRELRPNPAHVHVWRVRGWNTKPLEIAYRFFFPKGAEMRVADWSTTKPFARGRKLLTGFLQPEVHALSDGRLRVLVRTHPNFVLRKKAGKFAFDGISSQYRALNIERIAPWIKGTPTIEQFDAAWGDERRKTFDDVAREAASMDLTAEEVINILRNSRKKIF